ACQFPCWKTSRARTMAEVPLTRRQATGDRRQGAGASGGPHAQSLSGRAITVVGLGPGRRGLLTIDALEALRAATRLYLHTARHPAVAEIRGDLHPDVQIHTFDGLCETAPLCDAACLRIAETLLAAAAEGPLVYAVPGHPLMGEHSVGLLLDG